MMKKAQPTLIAEVFEFDSRSPAHEALMNSRRGFIQPFLRLPSDSKASATNKQESFFGLLFSVPFEPVQVRDDLGCDLYIWVNVPRWQLWLLGKRLPLLLLATMLLVILGAFAPLYV